MLSLLFGLALFGLGVIGPFLYEPCLGVAVYAVFTHITPQQLGTVALRSPFIVATATLISYLLSSRYGNKLNLFPAEMVLFSIMLLGMLFGAMNAFDKDLAFQYFYLFCKYGIFLWMFINILDSLEKVEIFNSFMILSAAWLVYRCWDLRGTTSGRFENYGGGIVGDSNHFAAALVMLLPLVLMRVFRKSRMVIRVGAALGVFGMIMSIIISQSRGGFLGLVALAVGLFFAYKQYRKRILIVVFVVAVAVSPFITEHYASKLSTIAVSEGEKRDASSQSRLAFWTLAVDVWQRNPIYGCGLRNFIYYSGHEREGKKWGEPGHVAHSLWFEALAEGGLLVFVPLISMIFLFFKRTNRAKRKFTWMPEVYSDIVALQVGMFGFLVCATFLNRLVYEPLYWWVGLAYVYDQRAAITLDNGNGADERQLSDQHCVNHV